MTPKVSPAQRALNVGFGALTKSNGERIHFRREFFNAIVNRDPFARVVRTPDFDPRDSSEVRIRVDELQDHAWDNGSLPRPGELIVTDDGIDHRIKSVKRLDAFVACSCVTAVPLNSYLRAEDGEFLQNEDGELIKGG